MKVILLAELQGRGGEGDVIEVKTGFATNYLFPRKIAVEATPGNLKQLEQRRHNIKQREEVRLAEAGDFRGLLDGKAITITVKVGEAGRLFGSVTPMMIADAIKDQLGVEVDRRKIETRGAIKTVGAHPVELAVYRDIKADFTVDVAAEGAVVPVSEEEAALAAEVEAAKAGTDLDEQDDVAAQADAADAEAGDAAVDEVAEAADDAADADTGDADEADDAEAETADETADEAVEEASDEADADDVAEEEAAAG
ncbi:MAG: 50S ribosomal protein L9 [Coriobacteriia bacterium]|nr:50S ribosomal protein L9 [Coriobacteriia bacterium]